ncbi:MAG: hypothetical protein KAT32_00225 [Candidatus Moranbacteria bacterium]|nr:hypothetical protein [Candidatus Moranbacteria bacterium]
MTESKEIIEESIEKLLNLTGFEGEISIVERSDSKADYKNINCNIEIKKDSNFIIGKDGVTLQSLESLLRIILFKKDVKDRIIIDINDYRESKKNNIKRLVLELAEKVAREKKPQVLKPMNAFERRNVHIFLENDKRVQTESIGEKLERKIVIKPQSIIESL